MSHPLDRPVWNALRDRQSALALGDHRARRFQPDIAMFAASADSAAENLAALSALIGDSEVALVEAEPMALPPGTVTRSRALCHQMIAIDIASTAPDFAVVPLDDTDAAQMLALATLTRPGPFFARTHALGGFIGVKQNGKLVAMAGERMKVEGFTEVSGVCTHPDHRGKGYAGGLMRLVAQAILACGEAPFLHVYADNAGAIALYETLGFRFRAALTMTVVAKI